MQKKKIKNFLNYFVGPLLFIVLSYSIFNQIKQQQDLKQTWQTIIYSLTGPQAWKLILVIILSLVNWAIESRKWQILMRPIQMISFFKSYQAVLTGLSLSLFIPNRLGEYLGRMLFMNEGNRLRSVALTLVGSLSQMIATLAGGLLGFILLKIFLNESNLSIYAEHRKLIHTIFYFVCFVTGMIILFYYNIRFLIIWVEKFKWVSKLRFFIEHVQDLKTNILTTILCLSFLRYTVFLIQYILLFQLFNVEIAWPVLAAMVALLFLVLIIIPSLPIAEIGIRGEVGLQLFGLLSANKIGIIATAAGIWLINLIIPAIAGALFILSIKLYSK